MFMLLERLIQSQSPVGKEGDCEKIIGVRSRPVNAFLLYSICLIYSLCLRNSRMEECHVRVGGNHDTCGGWQKGKGATCSGTAAG